MELPEIINSTFLSIFKDAKNKSGERTSYIMLINNFRELYSQKEERITNIIIPYFTDMLSKKSYQDMLVQRKIKNLKSRIQSLESDLQLWNDENFKEIDYLAKVSLRKTRAERELKSLTFESIVKDLEKGKESFIYSLSNGNNDNENFELNIWLETYRAYNHASTLYISFIESEVEEGRHPEIPIITMEEAKNYTPPA